MKIYGKDSLNTLNFAIFALIAILTILYNGTLFAAVFALSLLFSLFLKRNPRYIDFYLILALILLGGAAAIFSLVNGAANTVFYKFAITTGSVGLYILISCAIASFFSHSRSEKPTMPLLTKPNRKVFRYALLLILIFSFARPFLIFKGGFYNHIDSGLINYPKTLAQIYNSLFLWNKEFYGGHVASDIFNLPLILFNLLNLTLVSILGHVWGTEIFYGVLAAVANVGMLYLLYFILEGDNEKLRTTASIFGVILFSFYFYPQYGTTHDIPQLFLPFAAIAIYAMFAKLEAGQNYYKEFFGAALILAFCLSIPLEDFLLPTLFVLLPLELVLILKSKKKKIQLYIFSMLMLLELLILSPILYTTYSYIVRSAHLFFNHNSVTVLTSSNTQNIFASLQLFGTSTSLLIKYANNNPIAIIGETLTFLIGMFALYLFNTRKYTQKSAFTLAAILTLFVAFFFYNNFAIPLGVFFFWIFQITHFILIFRAADPLLYYVIFFAKAVLFTIGISTLAQIANKKLKHVLIVSATVLVLIHVYYFYYLPLQTNATFSIPHYSQQVANFLNNQSGDFNVATLPMEYPFGHYATFYYGTNIYSYLIYKHNVFTGGYIEAGRETGPTQSLFDYAKASNTIQNARINASYISEKFGEMGIRYIILQGDAAPTGLGINYSYVQYNISDLRNNLNNAEGVQLVAQFNTTTIYEIDNYTPLLFFGNSTVPANYAEVSPSEYTVQIPDNAINLKFRQEYDPWWTASFANGTLVSNDTDFNGINSWNVSSARGTTITLYYTPQKVADYLQIISAATFVGLIAAYFFFNNKAKKKAAYNTLKK